MVDHYQSSTRQYVRRLAVAAEAPSKAAIDLAGENLLSVKQGIANGVYTKQTRLLIPERDPAARSRLYERIQDLPIRFDNPIMVYPGKLESIDFSDTSPVGKALSEVTFDFAYFDLCGRFNWQFGLWLMRQFRPKLSSNATISATFCRFHAAGRLMDRLCRMLGSLRCGEFAKQLEQMLLACPHIEEIGNGSQDRIELGSASKTAGISTDAVIAAGGLALALQPAKLDLAMLIDYKRDHTTGPMSLIKLTNVMPDSPFTLQHAAWAELYDALAPIQKTKRPFKEFKAGQQAVVELPSRSRRSACPSPT